MTIAPNALHRFLAELPAIAARQAAAAALPAHRHAPTTTTCSSARSRSAERAVRPRDLHLRRRRRAASSCTRRRRARRRSSTFPTSTAICRSIGGRSILKIHGAVNRAVPDGRRGQLRDHRRSLHRLPDAHRPVESRARDAHGEAAQEPLPVSRLRAARLEPARDPAPHRRRAEAELQVVGDPAAVRPTSIGASGAGATSTSSTSISSDTCACASRPAAAAAARPRRPPVPECPYTGLMPFTEEQAEFFFGREAEREIITANLLASRLTLLYGPSGVGKSSVLNAGVVHELRARVGRRTQGASRHARVRDHRLSATWRDDPLAGLERAIAEEIGAAVRGRERSPIASQPRRVGIDGDLLIILDQFEEYFLYHAERRRPGHVRGRVSAGRQPSRPARQLPRLDARRLDREARLLQGTHSESLRQLPAHRSPRARPGARRDRQADRAVQPARRAGPDADDDRAGARRDGARPGHDRSRRRAPARERAA